MSKNELRVIARIMLIGVGLYVVLQTFLTILGNLAAMPLVASAKADMPVIIVTIVIYIAIALATVYFLARCANRFSTKIVEYEPIDDTQISWLAAAFRLVCVTAGIMFLYWNLYSSVGTVFFYMSVKSGQQSPMLINEIVKCIVLLVIGIYLACGAPGFVRWQVRRTLKQCGKIEEQKPTWD
jgi:hypothetical protein